MKKKVDLAYKVSIISIIVNIVLSIFKFIAGIIGNSTAMISDAFHSASDVASTIVVIIGIFISRKESDKKHPYGHEKFECLAAILLSIMLGVVGFQIGYSSVENIIEGTYKFNSIPGIIALIAAVVSIIVKEWMYRFTKKASKKLKSDALLADAWHHRSDALSSVGSLIGIGGSLFGYKIFDPLAAIVISVCIFKAAIDILKDAINKIIDTSADEEVICRILELVSEEEVKNIDSLKTRLFGSKIYVDLEISVDANLLLKDAHDIAEKIHLKIEEKIDNCKHCMVHVNPYIEE